MQSQYLRPKAVRGKQYRAYRTINATFILKSNLREYKKFCFSILLDDYFFFSELFFFHNIFSLFKTISASNFEALFFFILSKINNFIF